jgi:hypothetical protein
VSALDCLPDSVGASNPWVQGSQETLPLAFDFTPNLGAATISTQSATLVDIRTGLPYSAGLSGGPTLSGNVVTQTLTALVPGTWYLLTIKVNTSTGQVQETTLTIRCLV